MRHNCLACAAAIVLADSVWTVINWTWAFYVSDLNAVARISEVAWHYAHWPTKLILRGETRGSYDVYSQAGVPDSEYWIYAACVAQTALVAYVALCHVIPWLQDQRESKGSGTGQGPMALP